MLTQARLAVPVTADGSGQLSDAKEPSFYYPQLDGLRSLAFLLVFGSHAGAFFVNKVPVFFRGPLAAYNQVIAQGWSGVDLFFVLSAFLITSLLLREEREFKDIDYRAFIIRRALRIWPLYVLVVLVGIAAFPIADPAVISFGKQFGAAFFRRYVWSNLVWALSFMLNLGVSWGLVFVPADLMPLWSVSMEEQFYLVWPLLLKLLRTRFSRLALITIMLVSTVTYRSYLMSVYPNSHVPYYLNTFSRLDALIMGSFVAFVMAFAPRFSLAVGRFGFLWLLSSLTVFQCAAFYNPQIFRQHNPFGITLFAFGWMLFLVTVLTWSPAIKFFSNRLITAFGRLTYGMYLVHALVLNIIFNQLVKPIGYDFPSNESACLGWFLGLPITFGLAWILFNSYEKKFLKMKERFAKVKSGFAMRQS